MTIRQAKRSYWRKFCGSVSSSTPVGEVLRIIRKMKGTEKSEVVLWLWGL